MEDAECSLRQFWKGGRFLDQPFPDANASLRSLPQNDAPLPSSADPFDRDFLLLDLVLELDGPAQRVGKRRRKSSSGFLRSNPQQQEIASVRTHRA